MTITATEPRFRDLARLEQKARDWHVDVKNRMLKVEQDRHLSEAETEQKNRSTAVLDELDNSDSRAREVCEPVFVGMRSLMNEGALLNPPLRSHKSQDINDAELIYNGQFAFDVSTGNNPPQPKIAFAALTYGILLADAAEPPRVMVVPQVSGQVGVHQKVADNAAGNTIYSDFTDKRGSGFTKQFFAAVGEAQSYGELSEIVLQILSDEGDPDGDRQFLIGLPSGELRGLEGNQYQATVDAKEFALVMRGLAKRNVGNDEPQLRRRINEVLNQVQNVGSENSVADTNINLPDLEDIADQNIIAENVRVMGPMIVSAMFEELKVFQVVDRIVEQFQHGMLPIGPGEAGKLLYQYWRETPNRMSEQERRSFAAITLGIPGGNDEGLVNREFNDLWIRFVSSVSSFIRQYEVDSLLRSATPSAISHQQVRKSARDLANNLSLHGYGMAHYAAREVQSQVNFMIKLLSDREIKGAYGARDMWQVVDQVATYELGGAKTSSRYRTLATSGTIITAWLANNVNKINNTTGPLIDINVVRNPSQEHGNNHKATRNPSDYDLVNACELWLADTATSDSQVEELSQPREAPVMTSKPIPIPSMAQDILDGIGGMGLSANGSTHH